MSCLFLIKFRDNLKLALQGPYSHEGFYLNVLEEILLSFFPQPSLTSHLIDSRRQTILCWRQEEVGGRSPTCSLCSSTNSRGDVHQDHW